MKTILVALLCMATVARAGDHEGGKPSKRTSADDQTTLHIAAERKKLREVSVDVLIENLESLQYVIREAATEELRDRLQKDTGKLPPLLEKSLEKAAPETRMRLGSLLRLESEKTLTTILPKELDNILEAQFQKSFSDSDLTKRLQEVLAGLSAGEKSELKLKLEDKKFFQRKVALADRVLEKAGFQKTPEGWKTTEGGSVYVGGIGVGHNFLSIKTLSASDKPIILSTLLKNVEKQSEKLLLPDGADPSSQPFGLSMSRAIYVDGGLNVDAYNQLRASTGNHTTYLHRAKEGELDRPFSQWLAELPSSIASDIAFDQAP